MSQAFRVAVDRILPQLLTSAVNQRRIPQQLGQNIMSSIDNWFPQFMQQCPQGQIDTNQLAQLLDQFIMQNAGGGGAVLINQPQNNGYGYLGQQQPSQQFVAPTQNSSPFVNPQSSPYGTQKAPLFAQTKPPQSNNGSTFDSIKTTDQILNDQEEPEFDAKQLTSYTPKWLSDNSDVVITNNDLTPNTKVSRKVYPSDDRSDTFVRYDVTTDTIMSSNNDLFGYVSMLTAGDGDYIVGLRHKSASVITVPSTDMIKHINELVDIVNGNGPQNMKLKKVIKYLKGQSITVYTAFERLIIGKFNEALKSRCMHSVNSIGLKVLVTNLDTILDFLPEQANSALVKLVSNSQYEPTLNSVLELIFDIIKDLEVANDTHSIRNAIATVKGLDGIRMLSEFDVDPTGFTKKFVSESTVIVVPKTIVFTNMNLIESKAASEALDDEDAVVVEMKTCAFDNIIGTFITRVNPIRVILSQGFSMLIARTVDQELVYSG